jgi:ATP adenylyltransferase
MEHLWSPWRLAYITGSGQATGCVFCPSTFSSANKEQARSDFDSLVVFRGTTCYVILNLFPYNNGHLMVVPNRHIASLVEATSEELCELIELTRRAEIALGEAYAPHGLNMGINLGKPAGAGVLGHVHMHVVPRWTGDTNFMSIVGQTRVLPEELPATAEKLRPIFDRLRPTADGKR